VALQYFCYNVSLSWVVVDPDVIILNQLYPSALPQIQTSLSENVLEALVVTVNLASMADEVMPPYIESRNHCR
jgi:hypothetical protein